MLRCLGRGSCVKHRSGAQPEMVEVAVRSSVSVAGPAVQADCLTGVSAGAWDNHAFGLSPGELANRDQHCSS